MHIDASVPWILDLDGVVWTGTDPIAGSAAAIERLQTAGRTTLFVTNNSFSRISELEDKLAVFGISAKGMVISSAAAAASLVPPGARVFVLGGPGVVEALEKREVELVDAAETERDGVDIVVVGLDWNLSYERLSAAVLAIRSGATFIATNADSSYPSERGLLPGAGAVVAAVQTASGVAPTIAGKPHDAQARLVHHITGQLADGGTDRMTAPAASTSADDSMRYLMVGDRPDTDGLFAAALGGAFGLVLSGVTQASDLPTDPVPAVVADNLWDLVDRAF